MFSRLRTQFVVGSLFVVGFTIAAAESPALRTHADQQGFLRTTSGKAWSRVVIGKKSADSDHAFMELAFECDPLTRTVFVDEVRLVLLHKSSAAPSSDMPPPSVSSELAANKDDWEMWRGNAKLRIVSGNNNLQEVSAPQRQLKSPLGFAPDVNATSIRLNPLPARPREVTAYNGASKAIARAAVNQLAQGLGMNGLQSSFAVSYLSLTGLESGASFDTSGLERAAAIALNKLCGTP